MISPSSSQSKSTLWTVIRLLRWDKPAGRLILMIPALWGVFLAAKATPPLPLVGVIILGTLATSAAGCVINDLWDRDIDPQVERTRQRPLASRTLSVKVGIIIALIAFVCALTLAFYLNPFSNPLCFALCVTAVPLIIGYPLAKRFFAIPQLFLSVAWGFAVLISWTAVTGQLTEAAWVLWGATLCWTLGFDTIYAMSDREDDAKLGINSSALFFGQYAPEAVGVCFASTIALFAYLGTITPFNGLFWVAWALSVVLWVSQYIKLMQPNLSREVYGQLFGQNVIIGFILLAGIIIGLQ